jgi:tRNA-dihydrouridine synthase
LTVIIGAGIVRPRVPKLFSNALPATHSPSVPSCETILEFGFNRRRLQNPPVTPSETFSALLRSNAPLMALAPMQDVTTLQFMRVIDRYGGPEIYWTEYFRIHGDSRPEKWILDSITKNPTGKPVIAQMIGNDIPALVRNAKLLQKFPVAAIDLNLGCPAPIVYRKCAGGGLLREPQKIDAILGALRDAVTIPFTVKTRIGFESPAEFDGLLALFAKHPIDLLTVHARTVTQMYRPGVRYDLIAQAAKELRCPVLLNGNVFSAAQAKQLLAETQVRGLMIGRGAIRNPWLFGQIRCELRGETVKLPTGRELLAYIHELWDNEITPGIKESAQVQRMKKFTNFIGEGIAGKFLHDIRRVATTADFWRVCEEHLSHDNAMPLEPLPVSQTPLDLPAAF